MAWISQSDKNLSCRYGEPDARGRMHWKESRNVFVRNVGFLELNTSSIVYSDTGIWMQTIYQTTPQGQFDPWIG